MIHKGQVYKFVGLYGLIRPNEWFQTRTDVMFNKKEHNLKLGDIVEYEQIDKSGRRHAVNLKKCT